MPPRLHARLSALASLSLSPCYLACTAPAASARQWHIKHVSAQILLAEGRRRGYEEVVVLKPGTRLRKIVPLQMIRPAAELGGRRVAQATPRPGGPGKHKYIHTPAELLVPLEAFAAMPLGCEFAIGELPARHSFLRACAGRSLIGLGVVEQC